MRTLRHALTLTLLSLLASTAGAATFYVDDSGSNSNLGTIDSPFRTITYALTKVDGAYDQVIVRGGTYNERVVIWEKHGTASGRIYVQAYTGETPIIDGTGIGAHSTVSIHTSSYVTFSGFTVQNAPETAILIWNANNIDIKYNTVKTAIEAGIHAGADAVGGTHHILMKGNTVRDTVRQNIPGSGATSWLQAMSCFKADYVTFTENWVSKNYGEGIDCILSDNCTITKNTLWDNKGSNIYLDNAQYALVDGNYIYNSGNSEYFRDGAPSPGILIANEDYDVQNPATNLTITNNIVHRCNVGLAYYNSQEGGGLHYTLIANNTFYHSVSTTAGLIYIEDGATSNVHDTTVIDNNIFYQPTGIRYARAPTVGITWKTNNWYGGMSGTEISGVGDVLANPLLVNAGGWSASDYKLTSTSPVKASGTTESTVVNDHFTSNVRTAPYSIGAHEYN